MHRTNESCLFVKKGDPVLVSTAGGRDLSVHKFTEEFQRDKSQCDRVVYSHNYIYKYGCRWCTLASTETCRLTGTEIPA